MKYFFYGSAIDNGQGLEQYGLFDPFTQRLVLTSPNLNVLQSLAVLFSSRYTLKLVRLHTASNFTANLIDNSCCIGWSVSPSPDIYRHTHNFFGDVSNAKVLIHAGAIEAPIQQDLEYFMAAYTWITHYGSENQSMFYTGEILLLQHFIELPLPHTKTTEDFKVIFRTIYSEFDFEEAKKKIEPIIEDML